MIFIDRHSVALLSAICFALGVVVTLAVGAMR